MRGNECGSNSSPRVYEGRNTNIKPPWLQSLTNETFFDGCETHKNRKHNKMKYFCMHCHCSMCLYCLPSHYDHGILRVWRCTYQVAVDLDDMRNLINCSNIQAYKLNQRQVIYLNQRPESRKGKYPAGNTCLTCDKNIEVHNYYCSLSCKFNGPRVDADIQILPTSSFPGIEATSSSVISCAPTVPAIANEKNTKCFPPFSFRQRSKKGFPHRAPF